MTPLVYVEDVGSATILALRNEKVGESYIIASDTSIVMDELHQLIMRNIGKKAPCIYVPKNIALLGAKILKKVPILLGKKPIVTYNNIISTIVDRTFDISKGKKS